MVPGLGRGGVALAALKATFDVKAYRAITDAAALEAYVARAVDQGYVAFDTETTGLDPMSDMLVGVSLARRAVRDYFTSLGLLLEAGVALFEAMPLAVR